MPKYRWLRDARVHYMLAVACLAMATPILAWWAIGDLSTKEGIGAFHTLGPYHFDPHLELIIGGTAAAIAIIALAVVAFRAASGGMNKRLWAIIICVCGSGLIGAVAWRFQTAGVDGENIGGDLAALVAPCLIAGLFVTAAVISHVGRQHRLAKVGIVVAAGLTAPLMYGLLAMLYSHGTSIGVITHREYADVRIGESRSELHNALGSPSDESEQFFAPAEPGLRCEYYAESNAGTDPNSMLYRFCFRSNVLVTKAASAKVYGT